MSYTLLLNAKKGVKMALDSADHWSELIEAVREHGNKKVYGSHHAFISHFLDEETSKATSKGKATNTSTRGTTSEVRIDLNGL